MPTLKPFRQYDEAEVINGFYSYSGTLPVLAGTFVKIVSGFDSSVHSAIIGDDAYTNAVSPVWGVPAQVTACAASGDAAIGMLLQDVRSVDENGIKLIFNPRKAAANNWTISGQGCKLAARGMFMYSGIGGTVTPGAAVYLDNSAGGISTTGTAASTATKVGKLLGPVDAKGFALFKLEL